MAKKQFNPVEYKSDFMQLAQSAPDEAADVAMKWRERFVNQAEQMKKGTENLAEIGITGLSSLGAGFLDGRWVAMRDAMIDDWEKGGAVEADTTLDDHPTPFSHPEGGKDPTKLFGVVDKLLVGTLLLAAASIFNVFGKKYTPLVRAAALGTGAVWAGGVGHNLGYRRIATKLKNAKEEEEAEE